MRKAMGLAVASLALAGTAMAAAPELKLPVAVKQLGNGLTVVVSKDHSTPTFGISVVYKVGFRLEPKGRTGFAHLFEHMMFQGTPNTEKGLFSRIIQGGGGIDNGSTRYDFTNYIASAPVSALEPILWLESDRMRMLDFSPANLKNQQDVVKEEIRVNVLNRPYGLFFWTDVAGLAFDKWENAHDGYGSFKDLDAANVTDVAAFHRTYYAPNNAVIGIAGDVKAEEVFALVERLFGSIPAQPTPPRPDVSEKLNTAERSARQTDQFAQLPALAVGYKVLDPASPDWVATAVLGELLFNGEASRFYQRFVKTDQTVLQISGGLGWPLADAWSLNGPGMLGMLAIYKPSTDATKLLAGIQEEIDGIAKKGVPAADLERVKTKMLSDFYSSVEALISRADVLAQRQAFTGDAASANLIPARIAAVKPADLQRAAAAYLTVANRTWVDRQPAPKAGK
ncbi:MAG TPA: pitrilysin family protein [Thermoanaerobaculaceae bacterium]|nr:pitrilysin family protein [Thermoanaerobaculaceae bacterium]